VFGLSFSELVVVALVALVVIGPKDLPKVLRRLGRWAGTIRRSAADLRAQSGIDDVLRSDGVADEITEIRKLARGELDVLQDAAGIDVEVKPRTADSSARSLESYARGDDACGVREREYPRHGPDAYGALTETANVYSEPLSRSRYADDPLYVIGDPEAQRVRAPTAEIESRGPTLSTDEDRESLPRDGVEHQEGPPSIQELITTGLAEARS
jgi:sec-independent protein translocase protein TatB